MAEFRLPPWADGVPALRDQLQLLEGAWDGNMRRVKAALEAGANVNGHPKQPYAPIVAAIFGDQAGMIKFLLEQGADPQRPVADEVSFPCSGMVAKTVPGERALHIAARSGKVETVRLLLKKRFRADSNATDNRGRTPLLATCDSPHVCVEVVQLLLQAGADPALAQEDGRIPLHIVALNGRADLIDMLYSKAPDTLNRCAADTRTPLSIACTGGQESVVSKLLSLGATQGVPLGESYLCPLAIAAGKGSVGVVRVLINEGGIKAVGGGTALAGALCMAIRFRRVRILQLLLASDGEEMRSFWANVRVDACPLLHFGAGYCCPAVMSVLLEAGADEAARDSEGRIPLDVVAVDPGLDDGFQIDRRGQVATRRMLQRGPAYRARSWAWPSDEKTNTCGSDAGGTAAAAATAATVLSSPQAVKTPGVIIGVRIFRPNNKCNSQLFVRLVSRYCVKD